MSTLTSHPTEVAETTDRRGRIDLPERIDLPGRIDHPAMTVEDAKTEMIDAMTGIVWTACETMMIAAVPVGREAVAGHLFENGTRIIADRMAMNAVPNLIGHEYKETAEDGSTVWESDNS